MRGDYTKGPTVAIATHEYDLHAHAVAREIRERHGAGCHVLETDHIDREPGLTWSSETDLPPTLPDVDGAAVDVRDLDALWFRRIGHRRSTAMKAIEDPGHRDLVYNDSTTAITGTLATSFSGTWIDDPVRSRFAENKIVQLRAAREAGFTVPRTLVSQNPRHIRDFCAALDGQVVIKPVRGSIQAPVFTTMVAGELLADEAAMRLCPAIYQEMIPGQRHARVHCFGDRVLTAELRSPNLDWRPNLDIPASSIELPGDVVKKLHRVMELLGLTMGIFDLKLTDDGDYVWLEVNPQGQFLFIEGMCGLPLIAAMAEFLVGRARS